MVSKYKNGWGSFSLVQATLDAMEHFRDLQYDYFINLSGQCYPLKTIQKIKSALSEGGQVGYLECNPLPWDRWVREAGGFDRIYRTWYKPFESLGRVSLPRMSQQLPLGMTPYGGSQWFCLPREQVNYVLDVVREHPEIVRFYGRTLIPDEQFFQTILMNSPFGDRLRRDDNLRFIDWWKRCVPLPAVLLSEDVPRMLRSDKLFARKFDPSMDTDVLDILDDKIRGQAF